MVEELGATSLTEFSGLPESVGQEGNQGVVPMVPPCKERQAVLKNET